MVTRRHVLASALAAPAILRFGIGTAHAATTLKISHQFPGGTIDKGDFRDRLCRMFAQEVAKRSGGEIAGEVYPNSSLIKTNAQFSAMRKGALDISLYPMPYAGGELPETNIGLMPGLVTTYDQGLRWKKEPVGKALTDFLADKGIVLLTWVWQAGGVASRSRPLVAPEDAKGLKVRGGSREMDMVLQTAGAAVLSVPSNEIYAAMQTGACEAGITSSTSLISFRLEEVAKSLTSGAGASYWFMLEPLMMSKAIFDKLPKNRRTSSWPSARSLNPSAAKARRTTTPMSPRSTKRPAPRSARSTPRLSASGATLRAIPPGRTMVLKRRLRPTC
jgi:TRAP-type C4-dicarboxylate transport system substrate-binding protein